MVDTISVGELDPVISLGVITDHVSLAISIDIGPLGLGAWV